ncbi:thioredoxin-domain-containing protein [Canariomyces notabilis]|uniref:Thioredoxin-domain-containing protein n=1 Tax=Canariomyces notabilis TaxID=2074819 RepID=A0AAN6QHT4_9PEZI|nr:thioredoxin-domain-containing protein [Canariomyces arenarius]
MADKVQHIDSLASLKSLTDSTKYVVLDFTAVWCPPCKAIAPIYAKLAAEHAVEGKLAFGKVDVDEAPEVAKQFGVTAMPTFLFLVDGELAGVEVGDKVSGGGAQMVEDGSTKIASIRGADPKNLAAVVQELGRLAREEA